METHGTFATALNCMDGRCQEKAVEYAKARTGADHIDMITEPGIDGLLAGMHSVVPPEGIPACVAWVHAKAAISANGHGSTQCIIFGHCGCAGNQVSLEEHRDHLQKAREVVEGWGLFDSVEIAVFDKDFEIEPV